jgi:hypothetical protein
VVEYVTILILRCGVTSTEGPGSKPEPVDRVKEYSCGESALDIFFQKFLLEILEKAFSEQAIITCCEASSRDG